MKWSFRSVIDAASTYKANTCTYQSLDAFPLNGAGELIMGDKCTDKTVARCCFPSSEEITVPLIVAYFSSSENNITVARCFMSENFTVDRC
jgi:hypothetical protein